LEDLRRDRNTFSAGIGLKVNALKLMMIINIMKSQRETGKV
jgi:hypothetical protein